MSQISFEYARGRFVNPSRIIDVSVYDKQVPGKDNPSDYKTVYRVAITLDVSQADKNTIYSDPFDSYDAALNFAKTIPL